MKYILCVDDKNGMLLFGKRQSRDSELIKWIVNFVKPHKLFVSNYSAKLFVEYDNLVVSDNYLVEATENDFCFVENLGIDEQKANEFIICKWNRKYQADIFFTADLKGLGFKKKTGLDIHGTSHEKITIEIYKRG